MYTPDAICVAVGIHVEKQVWLVFLLISQQLYIKQPIKFKVHYITS